MAHHPPDGAAQLWGEQRCVRHILFTQCLSQAAWFGLLASLPTFLLKRLHYSSGAAASAGLFVTGLGFFTPIIGAWLADSRYGRFTTILGGLGIQAFGSLFLVVAALASSVPHSILVYLGLILVACGAGAVSVNLAMFGAEQYRHLSYDLRKTFFHWFVWNINAGAVFSSIVESYVGQDLGFAVASGVGAALLIAALVVLAMGREQYTRLPATQGVTSAVMGIVCAAMGYRNCCKSRRQARPLSTQSYEPFIADARTTSCWDRAKISHGGSYMHEQVGDVKALGRVALLLSPFILFQLVGGQNNSVFITQADEMDLSLGAIQVPSFALVSVDALVVCIAIPGVLRLYHSLADRGYKVTKSQRIKIGLVCAALSMICAGFVELVRRTHPSGKRNFIAGEYLPSSTLSVAWQIPQFVFAGLSDVFALTAGMELVDIHAPKTMRSMCMALLSLVLAGGQFLGSATVSLVNAVTYPGWVSSPLSRGHLDYYFFLLAGLSVLNLVYVTLLYRHNAVTEEPLRAVLG